MALLPRMPMLRALSIGPRARIVLATTLVAVGILSSPLLAAGSTPEDLAACQNEDADAAVRLRACGKVIDDKTQVAEMRAEALLNRGLVHAEAGADDKAVSDLTAAIALNPEYSTLHYQRGMAYDRQGKGDLAMADLDRAIRLDPTNTDALTYRAFMYTSRGEHDRALADHNEVIRQDPSSADAYAGRGLTYEAKGDRVRATADYRKALELEPEQEEARAGLERLFSRM